MRLGRFVVAVFVGLGAETFDFGFGGDAAFLEPEARFLRQPIWTGPRGKLNGTMPLNIAGVRERPCDANGGPTFRWSGAQQLDNSSLVLRQDFENGRRWLGCRRQYHVVPQRVAWRENAKPSERESFPPMCWIRVDQFDVVQYLRRKGVIW